MILMTAKTGTLETLVIIGIGRESAARIAAGEPLVAKLADAGIPGIIVSIMCGETEEALLQEFQGTGIKIHDIRGRR
jgi:hypothetical protein